MGFCALLVGAASSSRMRSSEVRIVGIYMVVVGFGDLGKECGVEGGGVFRRECRDDGRVHDESIRILEVVNTQAEEISRNTLKAAKQHIWAGPARSCEY